MLVLTRKLNEKIQLGDEITITVVRLQGNKVRLGIDAPKDVRVIRGELEPFGKQSALETNIQGTLPKGSAQERAQVPVCSRPTKFQPSSKVDSIRDTDRRSVPAPLKSFVAMARICTTEQSV